MSRLVRTELLKLRTMRVTYGLVLTAAALSALFASLEASRAGTAGTGVAAISTAAGLRTVTTVTGFAMLLAAVLGVISSSGEYRHANITLTYLATPIRARVLVAKALSTALAGAVFGLAGGIVATGVGLIFVTARGDHVALGAGALVGHLAGATLGAALFGALGVGLGSLVRSQIAAIIGIFAWGIVIESVLGGLFTSIRPYLPYTAATTLAGTRLGNAAFGPAHGLSGGGALPFVAAAALIGGIAALMSLLAARTTIRADVT